MAAYRGGYLPEDRRVLEQDLRSGRLTGVAATNALELGIDVSGLDAVLLAGFPGTRAAMWQQVGRAGRRGTDALAVLVARDDPLDTYVVSHPEVLVGAPVEATVFDPTNPYVRGPHLCAAAAELPLRESDLPLFADSTAGPDGVAAPGRPSTCWSSTAGCGPAPPAGSGPGTGGPSDLADLRSTGGRPVELVERRTGRVIGTVDAGSAHSAVHTGAVYLHQGESYVVDELDLEDGVATMTADDPGWSTFARDVTDIRVVEEEQVDERLHRAHPEGCTLSAGTVQVTQQVVAYLKKSVPSGEVLGEVPLDLPPRVLETSAVWWTVPPERLAASGLAEADLPGAAHAAEHASIGILPLVATCDRWDIGGVSTALHPDTGRLTVFVYDGHPGGAGFARAWLRGGARLAAGHPGDDRRLRVRVGLPVLRPVAQVRQPQQPAGEGRGRDAARRAAGRPGADRSGVSPGGHREVAAQQPDRDLGAHPDLVALDTARDQLHVVGLRGPRHVGAGRTQVLQRDRSGQGGEIGGRRGPPTLDHQPAADEQHDRDEHQGAGQPEHGRGRRPPLAPAAHDGSSTATAVELSSTAGRKRNRPPGPPTSLVATTRTRSP